MNHPKGLVAAWGEMLDDQHALLVIFAGFPFRNVSLQN